MPVIQGSLSIPANSVNDNVLAGSQFEFLPYNALLEFGLLGSAAGLLADVYSGQDTLAEAMALPDKATFPIYPDDFVLNDVAAAGERIKVRIRNTAGTAVTARWSVRITPA